MCSSLNVNKRKKKDRESIQKKYPIEKKHNLKVKCMLKPTSKIQYISPRNVERRVNQSHRGVGFYKQKVNNIFTRNLDLWDCVGWLCNSLHPCHGWVKKLPRVWGSVRGIDNQLQRLPEDNTCLDRVCRSYRLQSR